VRLIAGDPVQEPVMNVRVRANRCYMGAVLQALRFRGVRIVEECMRAREFVVRGQAPMQILMGLPDELAAVTEGNAAHWIRLAHYAPIPAPEAIADASS
jgi:translation elongation factor EF-G